MSEQELGTQKRGINWAEAGLYAVSAALTLVEPRNLTGGKRWAYKAAVAALSGASVLVPDNDLVGDGAYIRPSYLLMERSAWAVGISGATFGAMEPLLKLDALTVDWLRKIGCKYPRMLLALLTAGVGAAAIVAESKRRPTIIIEDGEPEGEPEPLSAEVQQVLTEMLAKTDDWGAKELRAQLEGLQEYNYLAEMGVVELLPKDDAPRTAVQYYEFPVVGTGTVNGVPARVSIYVEEGRLSTLSVEMLTDDEIEEFGLPENLTYEVGSRA